MVFCSTLLNIARRISSQGPPKEIIEARRQLLSLDGAPAIKVEEAKALLRKFRGDAVLCDQLFEELKQYVLWISWG